MPQSATANMGLVQPTEDGDLDVWDTLLTTLFGVIDEHDHTTGKGVKVPSAGLNINADVSWSSAGSSFSITDLKAIGFTPKAASTVSALSSALFVDDSGNLYFRNSSGTNVQLTDGSTLNVSIVGGIGGDYSSVSALLDYDDATDTYRFRQETSASVRQYGKIAAGDFKLFEYKAAGDVTVPTNAVTLKSPASLAAGYSITWPAAVPAADAILMMSSSGVVTADSSPTLPANNDFTISGTGKYKHGSKTVTFPVLAQGYISTAGVTTNRGTDPGLLIDVNSTVFVPLIGAIPADAVISQIEIKCGNNPGSGCDVAVMIGDPTFTAEGSAGAGSGSTVITISGMSGTTSPLWIQFVTDGSTTVEPVYFTVTYSV